MCGICGLITKNNISDDTFNKMVDVLKHRGPDDRGVWSGVSKDWNVKLGHRRLSVIDISRNGHQPMIDESGRYIIVFNGEIYNYSELKSAIKEFNFKSSSDTEVLLYLYIKYGYKCLDIINGMYSIAIYDSFENRLFIARDRMGKKPLYYLAYENHFVFASELKSFLYFPYFEKIINRATLAQYFSQNCILSPNTIYKNTYKLKPGEYLIWDNGIIQKQEYYSPIKSYLEAKEFVIDNYVECKKTLKELLYDSVEKRLLADVSVGTFLSGGIDSTLITAIANDIRANRKIDTFTIGFNEKKYDESQYALNIAKYLGVRHHTQIMSEDEMLSLLNDMSIYYDEPFSDASQLPTMLVSKFAKKDVTVVLSGDGGDELFAGYSNIDTLTILKKYDILLSPLRRLLPQNLIKHSKSDKIKILCEEKKNQDKLQYYAKLRENIANSILCDSGKGTTEIVSIENEEWMQQRMLFDMTTYLPDENLTKVDRGTMRFSLEARCPLLDYRIVDYSMKIPFKYKYKDGIKKYILKDILYDFVPQELIDRPKKGFNVPIYMWLNTILKSELDQYLDENLVREQGIFKYNELIKFATQFKNKEQTSNTQIMWSYFVFQRWYKKYMI